MTISVEKLNSLNPSSLHKLMSKIVRCLLENPLVDVDSNELFSEAEKKSLISLLELPDILSVTSVIRCCFDFLHSSAISLSGGESLEQISDGKPPLFLEILKTTDFKDMCEKFKRVSTHQNVLSDINYMLNVQVANSDSNAPINKASAVLQFTFDDKDRTTVELNHAQLYDFYNKLDCIQNQLDSFT